MPHLIRVGEFYVDIRLVILSFPIVSAVSLVVQIPCKSAPIGEAGLATDCIIVCCACASCLLFSTALPARLNAIVEVHIVCFLKYFIACVSSVLHLEPASFLVMSMW